MTGEPGSGPWTLVEPGPPALEWENGPVPWCPECDRFLSPNTVKTDGTCPACGRMIDAPAAAATSSAGTTAADDEETVPFPWHLKLLAAAVVIYLGFRAWEGVEWLLGKF